MSEQPITHLRTFEWYDGVVAGLVMFRSRRYLAAMIAFNPGAHVRSLALVEIGDEDVMRLEAPELAHDGVLALVEEITIVAPEVHVVCIRDLTGEVLAEWHVAGSVLQGAIHLDVAEAIDERRYIVEYVR